ncbi:MAG: phage major capsid protein [Clostridiales bacterium]|nr:phage major capsid protein [Clostridiales bacterium]MBQ1573045.1 phage major capsid protein [Clostridiales bacterium]
MGNVLTKGTLFPTELTNQLFSKVRGKSSLARLAASEPIPFNGQTAFVFDFDNEVNLVGENAAKANGGATIAPVSMNPVKVEYGMRISDEFRYAAEEVQLQYLTAFADGFAKKVARGLDIMAMHGLNPRTGLKADVLTNKNFDDLVSQTVAYDATEAADNVSAAINLITSQEHEVTGMAMSPTFKSALANLKKGQTSYEPLFPELGWGNEVEVLNGLPVSSNSTVSFGGNADRAIVGNYADFFKWGFARELPIEIIEYGDPDNTGVDLKGHNQVYVRGEAYIGWGIILPETFARIVANASA